MDARLSVPLKLSGSTGASDPAWRVWSKKARAYVARSIKPMKAAMLAAEKAQEPIRDLSDFGVTSEQDEELGEFLEYICEGEAWDIWDGTEGSPSLEAWRQLAKRFSPKGPACRLQETRKIMKPSRASSLAESLRAIQTWENLCIQHRVRHGSSPYDDEELRKVTLLDILPAREAEELESQMHMFRSYSDLKARIEEIVATRTGR